MEYIFSHKVLSCIGVALSHLLNLFESNTETLMARYRPLKPLGPAGVNRDSFTPF